MQDKALETFRGAYAAYCTYIGVALDAEVDRDHITAAMRGEVAVPATFDIYSQRRAVAELMTQARRAGVATQAITLTMREVREAVGSEWCVRIPLLAQA